MMGGAMGYTSNGLAHQSNVGNNTKKANAVKTQAARGGFGSSAKSSTATS